MAETISMEDVRKFAEEMRKVDWTNPMERHAIAQLVIKTVTNENKGEDIGALLGAETTPFTEGDTMQWVTRKGGKAYVHAPGSSAPRSTIVNRIQTLEAEPITVDLELHLDQLKSGRYGSISDLRKDVKRELTYKKWKIAWDTLRGSVTAAQNANGYQTIAVADSAATKASKLDTSLDYVEDQVGGASAIVGRRSDISWLLKWGSTSGLDYSDGAKDQILKTGRLATYRGVPIVPLSSFKDSYNAEMIATGRILIVSPETVKIGISKSQDVFETMDPHARIWSLVANEFMGCAIFFPERNGMLVYT